jgi:hypothetical protein
MDFKQLNIKIMKLLETFTKLASIIIDSSVIVSSELKSEENDELKYSLELFSKDSGFISMKFEIVFNKIFLKEKIENFKDGYNPYTENIDFQEYITRKNIQILPHLKEYNNKVTNYNKLAELYYDARGSVIGKRFGF